MQFYRQFSGGFAGRARQLNPMRAIAIAVSSCALVAACSSTQHSAAPGPAPALSSSSSSDGVQQYLDAVNALCDGLEQKIVALNGGQFDIPLKDFQACARMYPLPAWPAKPFWTERLPPSSGPSSTKACCIAPSAAPAGHC